MDADIADAVIANDEYFGLVNYGVLALFGSIRIETLLMYNLLFSFDSDYEKSFVRS